MLIACITMNFFQTRYQCCIDLYCPNNSALNCARLNLNRRAIVMLDIEHIHTKQMIQVYMIKYE